MVDATAGSFALDPGLGVDLLAAIADGDAQRAAVSARIGDLRDVSGQGDLLSARRGRTAILDCAVGATTTLDAIGYAWSSARSAITESAWQGLAADPHRWRGEFVAERLERPLPVPPTRELRSPPPERYFAFADPELVAPSREFRIPSESLVSMNFAAIEQGLLGVRPAAVLECAARWCHLASVLDSSLDSVCDLVETRCVGNGAVTATGVHVGIASTRRLAASWATIGNAVRSFGLGLRNAEMSIGALRSERDEAMATCAANPGLVVQQPVIWERFERRARTAFDETYGAGLFAFVAGLALAGDPQIGVGVDRGGRTR